MSKFRTASSERVRFQADSGTREVPTFQFDDSGELIVSGKTDLFAQIQSFKDDVLLDKILLRCSLSGESLEAPAEAFGDATILPKDLLEAKTMSNNVDSFKSSLSKDDLSMLLDKGFDEFIKFKVEQAQSVAQSSAHSPAQSEDKHE